MFLCFAVNKKQFSAHYFLQYCNKLRTIIKQTSMHMFCCGCLVTNFVFVCNKMGYPGAFFPEIIILFSHILDIIS